jgi:thiamine biosynthesis lipoprotein
MGCQTSSSSISLQRFSFAELHMATVFRLVVYAPDENTANRAAEAAFNRVIQLEDILSDYDPRSELSRLSQQPIGRPVVLSPDLYAVLDGAQQMARDTQGAFDITVGPMTQLWRMSRKTQRLPTPDQVAAARATTGYDKLLLNARDHSAILPVSGMRLDPGGIAKGYAADQALQLLRKRGLHRAMVAAGGDIAVGDPPPGQSGWSIAIDSLTESTNQTTPVIRLKNAGISTSGDTSQFVEIDGKHYSHIVDFRTGLGLTERIGATIVARDATTSDAAATAISVLGVDRGLAFVEAQPSWAARITFLEDGHVRVRESRRFHRLLSATQGEH